MPAVSKATTSAANPVSAPVDTQKGEYVAKVRKAGDDYKTSMLDAYRHEAEYLDLTGNLPPKVPKPTKAQIGLVTPEVEAKVRELMAAYPKGANGTEFNVILGLCGIVGVKPTGDARAELVTKGVITVEDFGKGAGRGNPKLIKLVATPSED